MSDDQFHWTGGDVVRGVDPSGGDPNWVPDPDVTYEAYPHYVRFPLPAAPAVDVTLSTLTVLPVGYDAAQVWWGLDPSILATYDWVCVTRSGFGYPATPNDGHQLLLSRRGDKSPGFFLDTPLPSGRWFYYRLFAKVGARWITVRSARVLVPIDYLHREHLWERIPPFYRTIDDDLSAGPQGTALRRLMQLLGYELDLTRTMAEGVENIWAADASPVELIEALGEQNFGLSHDAVLGDVRYRRLVARSRDLFSLRGTEAGIQQFVEAVTQYQTTVTLGRNIMLVSDDAEFASSTGHWARPSASLAQTLGGYHTPTIDTVRTYDITLSVVEPEEIATPVETVTNPDTVIGARAMKLTPKWSGSSWTAASRLCVVCGAGSSENFRGPYEQDPYLYGIPIIGGRLYYMSFYDAREGTRPVVDPAGNEIGTVAVSSDASDVRYGIAWYDRETLSLLNAKGFSDGFGPGLTAGVLDTGDPYAFNGFRRVVPMQIDLVTDSDGALAPKTWRQHVTSFEAPSGAEFAVPIIEYVATNVSARYIAGALVAPETGSGVEVGYGPDTFFVLGTDHRLLHQPSSSKSYRLGPPEIT